MGTNTSVEITHQTFSQALKDEQSAKDSTQINVGSLNISLPTYISEKARIFDIFQKAFYKGKKPLFFFFFKALTERGKPCEGKALSHQQ